MEIMGDPHWGPSVSSVSASDAKKRATEGKEKEYSGLI